jgi:hypothetical protein
MKRVSLAHRFNHCLSRLKCAVFFSFKYNVCGFFILRVSYDHTIQNPKNRKNKYGTTRTPQILGVNSRILFNHFVLINIFK